MRLKEDGTELPSPQLPAELEYTGEFGTEIACFLPTVYWLFRTGGLEGRRVCTYEGMRAFYYFLPDDQYREKTGPRTYVRAGLRPRYLANRSEHSARQHPREAWPDYRQRYAATAPRFSRPLLIVHNKYADEWQLGPINYIPCELLDVIFERFKRHYQIVYLRQGLRAGPVRGFSADQSRPRVFGDREVLDRHPQVRVFDDLLDQAGADKSYNELKLELYAKARFFISSQGGNCALAALFGGSTLLVMHRLGRELRHAYSQGFFRYAAEPRVQLLVARNDEQMRKAVDRLSANCRRFGRVLEQPRPDAGLRHLEASGQHDPEHVIEWPPPRVPIGG